MKVLAIRGDFGACGKYRIVEPSRAVKELGGFEIAIDEGLDVHAYQNTVTRLVDVQEVRTDADLIIIQRPLDNSSLGIIRQAKKQGIATIVDLDDDFHHVHPNSAAYSAIHGHSYSNAEWLYKACQEADRVTVSTQALMRYAPHGRVSVLRNYVPASIFEITPRYELVDRPGIVGWSGSIQTHPADLMSTGGRVGRALQELGLSFGMVGQGTGVANQLQLSRDTKMSASGFVKLENYYQAMVDTMDIGIVPLEKSNFNEAKSHLKGMEMAALGIPFIASPTHEYRRLESYGVGKVAQSPGDWQKYIKRWAENPDRWRNDAVNYREHMAADFTYEDHAQEWADAWTEAVRYRASSKVLSA